MNPLLEFVDTIIDIFHGKARDARVMARVAEEKRQRLVAMATDPVRRQYIARIERGEHWSDEDIAFNEQRVAVGVCEHLRPIEQRMRDEHIALRPVYPLRIRADCLVDAAKLGIGRPQAHSTPVHGTPINGTPVSGIAYVEVHIPDRSMLDPRSAMITCSICHSYIDVVHADVAAPDTPWFPRTVGL